MTGNAFADAVPLAGDVGSLRTRLLMSARAVRAVCHGALREHVRERLWRYDEKRQLAAARGDGDVAWPSSAGRADDLVTVRITTYGRPELLVERTLPSVFAQTHERLDILVVGDGADAATEKALRGIKDPRLRYVNLPYRPIYPTRERDMWKVLGYQALNLSLDLAAGAWIAPCDDDEFTPEHVEVLLAHAVRERAELVHSKTAISLGDGILGVIGGPCPAEGRLSHGALLYSSALRFFRYNGACWRMRRPLDWDLVLRMTRAGVRMSYLDEITYIYYPSPASREVWATEAARIRPELAARLGGPGGLLSPR